MAEPRSARSPARPSALAPASSHAGAGTAFDRRELKLILSLYGSKVAQGEWRDYAIDMGSERAVFSVFRRTSEMPLYRIEKSPRNARKQGQYSVVAQGGEILRRGQDLAQVLRVLVRRPYLVAI
ncbi:MAG TPA: DUF2794 domain-containing protein [Aestuariivirgaceae bacterium]|nr:DUF2794 domain-containing protein [Aestuariivirgaceae bacterium]